jgi:hypothetical protein
MLIFLVFYIDNCKIISTFVFIICDRTPFMNTYLTSEAKAWVKRKTGPDEIVLVIPDMENEITVYRLYIAYGAKRDSLPDDKNPDYLGRILFDAQNYWIYDGDAFTITEQEQLAKFIINYVEVI